MNKNNQNNQRPNILSKNTTRVGPASATNNVPSHRMTNTTSSSSEKGAEKLVSNSTSANQANPPVKKVLGPSQKIVQKVNPSKPPLIGANNTPLNPRYTGAGPPTLSLSEDSGKQLKPQRQPLLEQMKPQLEEIKNKMKEYSTNDYTEKINWLLTVVNQQQVDLDLLRNSSTMFEDWSGQHLKEMGNLREQNATLTTHKKKLLEIKKKLEEEVKQNSEDKDKLGKEKADMIKAMEHLEEQVRELKWFKEKFPHLKKEIEAFKTDKENSRKQIENLTTEKDRLLKMVDPRVEREDKEKDTLKVKILEMKKEETSMKQRINELEEKLTAEKKKSKEIQKELAEKTATATISDADKEMEIYQHFKKKVADRDAEIAQLKKDIEEKDQKVAYNETVIERSKEKVIEQREKIGRKKEELQKKIDELKEEQEMKAKIEEKKGKLTEKVKKLKRKIEQLDQQKTTTTQSSTSAEVPKDEQPLPQPTEELASKLRELAIKKEQMDKAINEVLKNKKCDKCKSLQAEIDELQNNKSEMTAVLYSKDVEIEDYRNKLKETEAALTLAKTTAINPPSSQDNGQQQQAKQQSDAARKRGREDMQSVDVPVDPASKRHKNKQSAVPNPSSQQTAAVATAISSNATQTTGISSSASTTVINPAHQAAPLQSASSTSPLIRPSSHPPHLASYNSPVLASMLDLNSGASAPSSPTIFNPLATSTPIFPIPTQNPVPRYIAPVPFISNSGYTVSIPNVPSITVPTMTQAPPQPPRPMAQQQRPKSTDQQQQQQVIPQSDQNGVPASNSSRQQQQQVPIQPEEPRQQQRPIEIVPPQRPLPVGNRMAVAAQIVTNFIIFIGQDENIRRDARLLVPEFIQQTNLPQIFAAQLVVIAEETERKKAERGPRQ